MSKKCSICGEIRVLEDFYADSRASDGKQSQCKFCDQARQRARNASDPGGQYARTGRKAHLRRMYGITEADYEAKSRKQRGRCSLCNKKPIRLYVDHCHSTGKVRGLICNECNRALGLVRDDRETLRKMIDYLENGGDWQCLDSKQ